MPLTFDSNTCSPPLPRSRREQADRERLAFASMAIGLGSITDDNAAEWVVRLLILEELCNPAPPVWIGNAEETARVVHRWIGLTMNVNTETRAKWLRRITATAIEQAEEKAERALGMPV